MWPFSRSVQEREAQEGGAWALAQGEYNGAPIVIRFREDVRQPRKDQALPNLVGIAVPLNSPNEQGFPEGDEAQQLSKIEDRVVGALERAGETMFVLVISTGGMREFVFYTDDADGVKRAFSEVLSAVSTHELQLMIQPDPEWSVYRQFTK